MKMVTIGSGAKRERSDWALSRYACYLVAMNGDVSKPEVAHAQAYFAIQTRSSELRQELEGAEHRVDLRDRMTEANKDLAEAAKESGVERFPAFQSAGYKGLYGGLTMGEIKAVKGLPEGEQILDRMGSTELAANYFRATQTKDKLRRDGVKGDGNARRTHHDVGQAVRKTIEELGGTAPEDIPPEAPIKELRSKLSQLRKLDPGKVG
jgi:DNA-damage-inducible protein D